MKAVLVACGVVMMAVSDTQRWGQWHSAHADTVGQKQGVAHFIGAHCQGLALNPDGELLHRDSTISVTAPSGENIHAAVLHEQEGILTVVTDKATVICYKVSGKNTAEINRFTPGFEAQTRTVRFTHVAGLTYLLCDDVKHKKELEQTQVQEYSDRYYRLALIESADKWHAIPADRPDEQLLGASYFVDGKDVVMQLAGGATVTIELPSALGVPFRSGPGDSLAQAVFLFPNQGIVCRTRQGWSVHDWRGKLLKEFAVEDIPSTWWDDPSTKDGDFYVHRCGGGWVKTYLLDMATGTLVRRYPLWDYSQQPAPRKLTEADSHSIDLTLSDRAKQTVPDLVKRLSSSNPMVAWQLVTELADIRRDAKVSGRLLRYQLSDQDYCVILHRAVPLAMEGLTESGPGGKLVERILRKLGVEWSPGLARAMMLTTIQLILEEHECPGVDQLLVRFLDFEDQRRWVARMLVELRSPRVEPYLVEQLQATKPSRVWSALQDLVKLGATGAAKHVNALMSSPDADVRRMALWALVELDARDYRQVVYDALDGGAVELEHQPHAIAGLVRWSDPRAVPMAMAWLRHEDTWRRSTMAGRLVELDAKPIVQSLVKLLADPATISGKQWLDTAIRRDAMRVVAALDGNQAVAVLRQYLREGEGLLANDAAEHLGRLRSRDAVGDLLAVLDRQNASGWFRAIVLVALARIGEPDTIPRLLNELRAMPNSDWSVQALYELNVASDPETLTRLRQTTLENTEGGPVAQHVVQLSRRFGISIVLSDGIGPDVRQRGVAPLTEPTAEVALHRIVAALNRSGHEYSVFIDKGVVHIAPIPEILERWEGRHFVGARLTNDTSHTRSGIGSPGAPPNQGRAGGNDTGGRQ